VTIGNLLKNEAYIGRLVYAIKVVNPRKRRHKEEPRYLPGQKPIVVDGVYARLVTDEEFAAAQRLRQDRADKLKGRRGLTSTFLLSRLMKCAKCGFTLVGVRNSNGQTYYACQGSTRYRADCDCRLMRQEDTESRVLQEVRREFSMDNRERLIELYRQQRTDVIAQAQATLAAVQADYARIQAARKRWVDAFEQGTVNPVIVNDRLTELANQEAGTRIALEEASRAMELAELQAGDVDESALTRAVETLDVWDTIGHEQRKHLLRYFIHAVIAYVSPDGDKRMHITFNTKSLAASQ
jgi:hypothetical protein